MANEFYTPCEVISIGDGANSGFLPPVTLPDTDHEIVPDIVARPSPYVDQGITTRNVTNPVFPDPLPAPSGSKTLGSTRTVYAEDAIPERDLETANPTAPAMPSAPLPWRTRRDPYANGGMAGQPFFDQ